MIIVPSLICLKHRAKKVSFSTQILNWFLSMICFCASNLEIKVTNSCIIFCLIFFLIFNKLQHIWLICNFLCRANCLFWQSSYCLEVFAGITFVYFVRVSCKKRKKLTCSLRIKLLGNSCRNQRTDYINHYAIYIESFF